MGGAFPPTPPPPHAHTTISTTLPINILDRTNETRCPPAGPSTAPILSPQALSLSLMMMMKSRTANINKAPSGRSRPVNEISVHRVFFKFSSRSWNWRRTECVSGLRGFESSFCFLFWTTISTNDHLGFLVSFLLFFSFLFFFCERNRCRSRPLPTPGPSA